MRMAYQLGTVSLVILRSWFASLYDYQVHQEEDMILLAPTESSSACGSLRHAQGLLPDLLELCAGIGGMGHGAAFVGGRPKVAVDHNPLSVQHLRANHHGHVLSLDITDSASPKLIHQACTDVIGTTLFGFPCQPYSTQGSQLGAFDTRFKVFLAGLRIIFLVNHRLQSLSV